MRQAILFCLLAMVIVMIFACGSPKLKKDDLLIEPSIIKAVPMEKAISLYVEIFSVARTISNPTVVGEARTGMFNTRTSIHSEDAVHLIVSEQIKKAFLKAGFKLEEKEKANFTISGQVERFWVNERVGGFVENAKASVKYDLIVKDRQGRFVWGDNVVGRATAGKSMDVTKEDVPTLMNALKESIESVFKNESFWKAIQQ